jgi:hypothetical protein
MADRYWVGGTGNWSDTARWSTSSGGSSGASVPTSADNVIFDANSNTLLLPFTVTVDGTVSAPSQCLGFTASGLDGAMTLAFGSTGFLECFGSMTFQATNFSVSNSGSFTTGIIFSATTTGNTFTANGVTVGSSMSIIFSGTGGGWTLGSALTTTSGLVEIRNGSFNTGNFNITANTLNSTSTYAANTRAITLGSSTISLVGAAAPLTMFNGGTLTFNAGTSTITFSNASPTMAGGGETFYNVSFTATGAGTVTITGANTFNNFTQTSRNATGTKFISLAGNQTVSGTLTLGAANTAIRRIIVLSSVVGTQRTITLNGTLAALADVDFRDINAAGTVGTPWTGTRLGDCLGNANITFDAAKTVYWNLAGTQNWSATGWATTNNGAPAVNNFPLAQDTATFTEAGAAGTVTIDAGWNIGNIQMADGVSNRTTAFTFATGTAIFPIYGNVTLFSSLTLSGTGRINFNGQGATKTITSASISFTQPFTIEAPSGTFQLSDNLTNTSALGVTLTQGTLDLNDFDLTCNIFSSSNANTRAIDFGTGNINVTGNAATVINIATSTNLTYTGTPTVNFSYSGSTGTRTLTYGGTGATETNALNLNVTAGTDIVAISNASQIKNLSFTGFTGTLNNNSRTIYGNLTIPSGMTVNDGTAVTTFAATSGTQQVTTNGQTLDFPITQNNSGATLQLQDNLTSGSTRTYNFTAGILDLTKGGTANLTLTTGFFSSSNSNTRSILFGTGSIDVNGNNGAVWQASTVTNFSYTGTPTINATYNGSSGTRSINANSVSGNETNALTFNITAGSDAFGFGANGHFKTLNFTGFTGTLTNSGFNPRIYGNLTFSTGMTVGGGTGQPVFQATSGTQQITTNGQTLDFPITVNAVGATVQLQDDLTLGSTRAFTLTAGTLDLSSGNRILSTGRFASSNSDTRSIAFGTGQIDLTGNDITVLAIGTATNFSFTGTSKINATYSGSVGTRVFGVGTLAGATEANSLNINVTAGNDILDLGVIGFNSFFRTIDLTGFSGTISNNTRTIYGNLIISSGITLSSGSNTTTFSATSGTQQLTTNGKTLDFPITVDGVGGTTRLEDNLTMGSTKALTLTNGTLNANDKNVTCGSFSSNNANTRVLTMGSGTWTIQDAEWNITDSTGMTLNRGTSTITMTSTSAKAFAGGGLTYYILNQGGNGDLTLSGANTFYDMTNTVQPCTIAFPASINTSFTNFNLNGTLGNLVSLRSSSPGTRYTLVKL